MQSAASAGRKARAGSPFELLQLLKPEAARAEGDSAAMALTPTLLPDLGYQARLSLCFRCSPH